MAMGTARSIAVAHGVAHGLRLLEAALLGRGHAPVERVIEHAVRLGSDRAWCMRCGASLVQAALPVRPVAVGQGPNCRACERSPAFDGFVRLGRYDSPLGALARTMKSDGWHAAAACVGARLAREVQSRFETPVGGWCVVPIPGSVVRRVLRGIDHAHVIGQAVARDLAVPFVPALSSGSSTRQAQLDRRQRLSRRPRLRVRQGAFNAVLGRSVLLVDDIRTTGSTLREARELLWNAGFRVVVPAVLCTAERRKTM